MAERAAERAYLPAMNKHWLLPLYDPIGRLFGVRRLHRALVDQAELRPGQRVLEIGCGTGNLTILLGRRQPGLTLTGLDPDPKALALAGRKARRAGLPITFDRGYADDLPYPDGSVDRVFSALMLHHLPIAERRGALAEVLRVLAPDGTLHVVDFDGAHEHAGPPAGRRRGHGHGGHDPAAHDPGDIAAQLREAGFGNVRVLGGGRRRFGTFQYFRADRP